MWWISDTIQVEEKQYYVYKYFEYSYEDCNIVINEKIAETEEDFMLFYLIQPRL